MSPILATAPVFTTGNSDIDASLVILVAVVAVFSAFVALPGAIRTGVIVLKKAQSYLAKML